MSWCPDLEFRGIGIKLKSKEQGDAHSFVWNTPGQFDEFEVKFAAASMPDVPAATELFLVRRGAPQLRITGPSYISMDVWDCERGAWAEVYSKFMSTGTESLDGLRLDLDGVTVGGLRLRSSPPVNHAFTSWGECEVVFNTQAGASVSITAEDVVSTSAPTVSTTAGTFEVDAELVSLKSAAGTVQVTADRFAAISSRFEALTKAVSHGLQLQSLWKIPAAAVS